MAPHALLPLFFLGISSSALELQADVPGEAAVETVGSAQDGAILTLTPMESPPVALPWFEPAASEAISPTAAALAPTTTRSWTMAVSFDTDGDGQPDVSQVYAIIQESYQQVSTRQVGPYGEGVGLFGSDQGDVSYDPSQDPIATFMPYSYGTLVELGTPIYSSPTQTPAYRLARSIGAEIDVYVSDNGRSTYVPAYGIPLDASADQAAYYHRPIFVTVDRRWDEWTVAHYAGGQYYPLATMVIPKQTGVRFDVTSQFDGVLSSRGVDLDAALNAIDNTSSFLGVVAELGFDDYRAYRGSDAIGSVLALAEFLGGLAGMPEEHQLIFSAAGFAVDLYEIFFQGSATGFVGGLVMSAFLGRLMQASADMQAYQRALHITSSNYFAASLQRAAYVGIEELDAGRPYARIYQVDSNTWALFPTFGSMIDDLYWGLYGPDANGIQRHGLWGYVDASSYWHNYYTREPASALFGAGSALGALTLDTDQVADVNGNGPDAIDLVVNAFHTGHRAAQRFSEQCFGYVFGDPQWILDDNTYAWVIDPATVFQTRLPVRAAAAMTLISYLSLLNERFNYAIHTSMPGYAPDYNVRATIAVADDNLLAAMGVLGRIHAFSGYWGAFGYQDTDVDFATADADGDGVSNAEEENNGTDKYAADTDGDGLNDGDEAPLGCFATLADTDADGILDGAEDYDADGLTNHEEIAIYRSHPALADFDLDRDGIANADEKSRGLDPGKRDTDGDGVIDGSEVNQLGTDPLVADTDGDGLADGREAVLFAATLGQDFDGDGFSDGPLDSDSDADGRSDKAEYDEGTNLLGANQAPTVVWEAPSGGATVSGTIGLQARATDADGFANVIGVRFYRSADGAAWSELTGASPGADGLWTRSFDTYLMANGRQLFRATVSDKEQAAGSSVVEVSVANPNRAPGCTIASPNGGQSIPCSSAPVTATASDPDVGDAVVRVEFAYSAGNDSWVSIGSDTDGTDGWSVAWTTSGLAGDASYLVRARAYDGNLYSAWDCSDASFRVGCPYCGDGSCNGGETCSSCQADCGICPYCGDGSCNGGESCSSCQTDCACKVGTCAGRCPGTSWSSKCKCPDGFIGVMRCSCSSRCVYSCGLCLCPL